MSALCSWKVLISVVSLILLSIKWSLRAIVTRICMYHTISPSLVRSLELLFDVIRAQPSENLLGCCYVYAFVSIFVASTHRAHHFLLAFKSKLAGW